MAKFDLKKAILENKATFFGSLTEGQFSWMTQDTGQQIGSQDENKIPVYMFDDKGKYYYENDYDGYGVFGGKDYYELLDQMNGGTGDRERGIDLAFDKEAVAAGKILFPALVTKPDKFNYKQHNFAVEAETDPNQSWYEPEEDEEDNSFDLDDEDFGYNDDEEELDEIKEIKPTTKMKKSDLKAKIKEMIVAEMALDIDNMEDAPESEVDFLAELEGMLNEAEGLSPLQDYIYQYEIEISGEDQAQEYLDDIKKLNTPQDVYDYYAYGRDWQGSMDDDLENIFRQVKRKFKNLSEADETEKDTAEAEDVTVDDTETIDTKTTTEVDPNVKAVQDALTQAQASAQKLGDDKLTDQIGNTITFFTRTHVVEKPGYMAENQMESDDDIGYEYFYKVEGEIDGSDIDKVKRKGAELAKMLKQQGKISDMNLFFRGFMDSWRESGYDETADKEDMYESKKPVNESMDFPEMDSEFEGAMETGDYSEEEYLQDIIDTPASQIDLSGYYEVENAVEQGDYSRGQAIKRMKTWAKNKMNELGLDESKNINKVKDLTEGKFKIGDMLQTYGGEEEVKVLDIKPNLAAALADTKNSKAVKLLKQNLRQNLIDDEDKNKSFYLVSSESFPEDMYYVESELKSSINESMFPMLKKILK